MAFMATVLIQCVNMKLISSLVLLLLCSCAAPNVINPAFQPLYNQFVNDARNANVDLSGNRGLTVQFASLEQPTALGEVIGECVFNSVTVSIDTDYWNYASPEDRQALLYHELGHCLLLEQHSTDPNAIMYPILNQSFNFYTKDWNELLNQLFRERNI